MWELVRCDVTPPTAESVLNYFLKLHTNHSSTSRAGIFGKEGGQAVRACDFAIARFRFLRNLMFVHGHYFYRRIATVVFYFFYKVA